MTAATAGGAMGASIFAVLVLPASGWLTQMQSKYGVTNEDMALGFNGTLSKDKNAFQTNGYYWHWPENADSNRGLGGGIQWAWDDALCKETSGGYEFFSDSFEDQFKEDFFFASFVTCLDIKASLHRAFQTWQDMHPFLHFVDVTEECRQVYGKVESNCSLVELFITNRNNSGIIKEDGHEKPFPNGGAGYPWGDPYAVCNYEGATDCTSDKSTNRRQLTEMTGAPAESASSLTTSVAAASATQYGRYASDLRATNGVVQKNPDGSDRQVIETYGGIISFNLEECWYLDSAFCAPLHKLKAQMGTDNAQMMLRGISWGTFSLAALSFALLLLRVMRHQHCCGVDSDGDGKVDTCTQRIYHSMEELAGFGVMPLLALLTCLVVPISLEHNIFSPCWQCYDFEAAAVHEIGHILGFNHPDQVGTIDGYPEGCSSHNAKLASMDGSVPYLAPGQPEDLCMNPWKYSVCGPWQEAIDAGEVDPDTGVRNSIMEAFTEHNPQTCLLPDDIESLNVMYPICTGRDMSYDTVERWNCGKSDLNIGWVRVLVYIGVPVALMFMGLTMTLSCLKHHEERKHKKMEDHMAQTKVEAKKAKKEAAKQERRATVMAEALEEQVRTEDARVEERAQQLAAEKIQALQRRKQAQKEVDTVRQEQQLMKRDTSFIDRYDVKNPGSMKAQALQKKQSSGAAPKGMPPSRPSAGMPPTGMPPGKGRM
jgi:hypothetical protein